MYVKDVHPTADLLLRTMDGAILSMSERTHQIAASDYSYPPRYEHLSTRNKERWTGSRTMAAALQ